MGVENDAVSHRAFGAVQVQPNLKEKQMLRFKRKGHRKGRR